ncbi:MAG: hypothetical protein K6357_04025 [Elusimicrobiota bacterium]
MKILNRKLIFLCVWIFLIPIIISSHNLKLRYRINKLENEIKKIRTENQYLEKNYYSTSTLAKIQKSAQTIGLSTPQPYTIIIIEEEKRKTNESATGILASKLNKLLKNG